MTGHLVLFRFQSSTSDEHLTMSYPSIDFAAIFLRTLRKASDRGTSRSGRCSFNLVAEIKTTTRSTCNLFGGMQLATLAAWRPLPRERGGNFGESINCCSHSRKTVSSAREQPICGTRPARANLAGGCQKGVKPLIP